MTDQLADQSGAPANWNRSNLHAVDGHAQRPVYWAKSGGPNAVGPKAADSKSADSKHPLANAHVRCMHRSHHQSFQEPKRNAVRQRIDVRPNTGEHPHSNAIHCNPDDRRSQRGTTLEHARVPARHRAAISKDAGSRETQTHPNGLIFNVRFSVRPKTCRSIHIKLNSVQRFIHFLFEGSVEARQRTSWQATKPLSASLEMTCTS